MDTIGFIGAGNMAEAIIKGTIESGIQEPETIMAADILAERLRYLQAKYGIRTTTDNAALVCASQTVVLSVKPQKMAAATESIAGKLRDDVLVVSIAAGITTDFLAARLGEVPIIRVMPNTPALVREGMSAIYNRNADEWALNRVTALLGAVGKTVVVEDESLIDAVTAVSGSGPAYFFLLMEEMTAAAQALGIPEETAKILVCQTAKGAGTLAMTAHQNNEGPGELRKKVTSPGGTTEAAISVFQEKEFGAIVMEAVRRARERGKELSSGG